MRAVFFIMILLGVTTSFAEEIDGKNVEFTADGLQHEFNLSGKNGVDGIDGKRGEDGRCNYFQTSDNGGSGGYGTDGTRGGNAGNFTVFYKNLTDLKNIKLTAIAGRGGKGGEGGPSGYPCGLGEFGNRGENGKDGRDGKTSSIMAVKQGTEVPMAKPSRSSALEIMLAEETNLTAHLFEVKPLAEIFAVGSKSDEDIVKIYQSTKNYKISVKWNINYEMPNAPLKLVVDNDNIFAQLGADIPVDYVVEKNGDTFVVNYNRVYKEEELKNFLVTELSGYGEDTVFKFYDKSKLLEKYPITVNRIIFKTDGPCRNPIYLAHNFLAGENNEITVPVGQIVKDDEASLRCLQEGKLVGIEVEFTRIFHKKTILMSLGADI